APDLTVTCPDLGEYRRWGSQPYPKALHLTDLGPYLLGQLPPPIPAPAAGLAPASASGGAGPERPSPEAARPQGAPELPRAAAQRSREAPGPQSPSRDGAVWQQSAPPCGRGWDCLPREEAAGRPASAATQLLAVTAGPPSPPCAAGLCWAPAGPPLPPDPPRRPGPARAEVRQPPGSPMASRRKRSPTAAPHDPAAFGASGSGQVPCDVAARWGRLRAGGRADRPGGAEPGRGAVPQLDGRGRPERLRRRRRRTVSDRRTPRARAPDETDSADPLAPDP
ncbi:hypothetical protein EI555_005464, partial [Monodon monoceros]